MLRLARILACVLAVLCFAAPASAGLRVTFHGEELSQHELFVRLNKECGVVFRGNDNAGTDSFKGPPGKRVSFDWKDAAMGKIVRDICDAYGLVAYSYGSGQYGFQPGTLPKRAETIKDGIAFSLGSISESEVLTVNTAAADRKFSRELRLQVIYRALDGEGDIFAGMPRLAIVEENGKSHEQRVQDYSYLALGLPDEDSRSLGVPWQGELPKRLRAIEGELALYTEARDHRFRIALPGEEVPADQQLGPVKLKFKKLSVLDRSLNMQVEMEWPDTTEVAFYGRNAVRMIVQAGGGRFQVPYRSLKSNAAEPGTKTGALEYTGQFGAPPTSLEIIIPTRTGPLRKIPFRLENVLMPFGRPFALRMTPLNQRARPAGATTADNFRVSGPFYDREGGTLLLPKYVPAKADEKLATVGLSRREDSGWSAVRWVQLPVRQDMPLKIPQVAPGDYQVRLRDWNPTELKPTRMIGVDPVYEVRVSKGVETKL
jgi:hypothetical protein